MNLLLRMLPHNLPAFIRNEILAELFEATANAFGCKAPVTGHLSYDQRLLAYARFTREQAEKILRAGTGIQAVKSQLYQNAYILGKKLRQGLAVSTLDEVMALGTILYRAIGVEMQGDANGEMAVQRCCFSQYYTGCVCDLISALDDGVFSGLSGGGRLVFSERMTEGRECCRMILEKRK